MHKKIPKFFVFLDQYDSGIFENKNTNIGIIYRNYNAKNRINELIKISKACKANRKQLFVSNDIKLTIKVKAEGVYIPSFNKKKNFSNLEKKNMKILGSAHNAQEIKVKISQNCSAIFLSPIFKIQKNKHFLGLHKFNYLSYVFNNKVLALGGISEKNIHKLKLLNIDGFGGIRFFQKKTGLLKAGFHKE